MNKPANPLQAIIEAASKKAASPSVTKALQHHQQRAGKSTSQKRYILADVSGSMGERAGSMSKIDLLRKALSQLSLDYDLYELIAFDSTPERLPHHSQLPSPRGSTALHLALDMIAPERPASTLVISDGHPDSAQAALDAADKVTGKIDVLYIGPDDDLDAIRFMYQLAGRTGGKVQVRDIVKQKSLPAEAISGFLN